MRVAQVNQCLDRKLTMLGFEVVDLFAIFLTLSVLNLIFGQSSVKWLFVWIPTISVALLLRYGKKGKPEKYLLHWFKFQLKPGVLSAFEAPSQIAPPPKLESRGAV